MKAKYGLRALASLAKEYGKGPLLISDISSRVIPVIIFKDKLMQHTIWRVFQVAITVAAVYDQCCPKCRAKRIRLEPRSGSRM